VIDRVTYSQSLLSANGAMGIAEASVALHSAVSYIQHLGTQDISWKGCHLFQLRFLLLRLDFLDCTTVLRHLAREMRLIGKSPSKYTRSVSHLRNVARNFATLASRYIELQRHFGPYFRDGQSNSSLNELRSLASFMAHAAKVIFPVHLTAKSESNTPVSRYKVNSNHPLSSLMQKLDTLLLQNIDAALDAQIRAAALLEIIDGLLIVPLPFPRDFFVPIQVQSSEVVIFSRTLDSLETFATIETSPSMGFDFYVSGRVPNVLLQRLRAPSWTVLLWFRFKYTGRLVDDDDNDNASIDESEVQDARMPTLNGLSPASTTLNPNGRFCFAIDCPPFLDEGIYALEVKLGCRDTVGKELEISIIEQSSRYCTVRVSRSRSLA
jgi:hypothetical protein